ncbi:winged helix-turn-helix domain-containing protein [Nonomuraea guangzhouensis]|uniref:Winged helix-turn-helix domain-containing protein n=1 Tax=Nonomuraea guangzhouensis TaxID=1291555 RepID=A0ABW4G6H5_9ACTN|nr:GntR family transcriptional regulator [Nonomuraea guangzhouensis]
MIDPKGEQPVYLQVAASLRERIESGEWLPRHRLPRVAELESEYGVVRSTILEAINHLRDSGYVTTVPNWGTVVRLGSDDITVVMIEPGDCGIFRVASEQESERLGLDPEAAVFVLEKASGRVAVLPADKVEIRGPEL